MKPTSLFLAWRPPYRRSPGETSTDRQGISRLLPEDLDHLEVAHGPIPLAQHSPALIPVEPEEEALAGLAAEPVVDVGRPQVRRTPDEVAVRHSQLGGQELQGVGLERMLPRAAVPHDQVPGPVVHRHGVGGDDLVREGGLPLAEVLLKLGEGEELIVEAHGSPVG
jgi:hypothetical protein